MRKDLDMYEDFLLQVMVKLQNHIDRVKVREDIFGKHIKWERLNGMQAWTAKIDDLVFLKSYDTIVAVSDGKNVYLRGKTTSTTAKQVSVFANGMNIDNLDQNVPFFKYSVGVRL